MAQISRRSACPILVLALALGCGGDTTGPTVACSGAVDAGVAVGTYAVFDPAPNGGCLSVPPAGGSGAEYLIVAYSGSGKEMNGGTTSSYRLSTSGATAAFSTPPLAASFGRPGPAETFHSMLRQREQALAAQAGAAVALDRAALRAQVIPPAVGDLRDFNVCSTAACTSFTKVTGRVRHVGARQAIYLDTLTPTGGYTQIELDSVGLLFDSHLYPIDTTAFGRESDLDGNSVVVILLTPAVNQLTPNCNSSGSVVLGYFFGNDLTPGATGSNNGEIFYSLVPDPDNAGGCKIDKQYAKRNLAPTFIHEFQHMISWNQHVLIRGQPAEETWLNEGLSHFAEELGARQVPNAFCQPIGGTPDCFSQFAFGDIDNAYRYLDSLEQNFLIEPSASTGTLGERGANWLFVRWIADQYGQGDTLGHRVTRALLETSRHGADNVVALTGVPFEQSVGEWQLSNYLDDLPGFNPQSQRLQYLTWNFRRTYAALHASAGTTFLKAYPLTPDSVDNGNYSRKGVLRGGSGRHLILVQQPSAATVTLQLTDSLGRAISNAVVPRFAVARVR